MNQYDRSIFNMTGSLGGGVMLRSEPPFTGVSRPSRPELAKKSLYKRSFWGPAGESLYIYIYPKKSKNTPNPRRSKNRYFWGLFCRPPKRPFFETFCFAISGQEGLETPLLAARVAKYMLETGTICQIVVLIHKRCIVWGPWKGHFQAIGTIRIVHWMSSLDFLPFGENQHKPNYSQMLCFVVFGHLNPFDMIDVKSRPTKTFWVQKYIVSGLKRQSDKG